MTGASPDDGLPGRERLEAMVAISVAVGMASLDTAVANTALPTIASDLAAHGADAIWVVNAYQLAMVAALLPLASLSETFGHRRIYIAGLALFTVTSLACGLAWSLPSLIAARALQGLGAAAIMSVNTALIRFIYPAKRLGRGVGINALVVGIGFTLGPTVTSSILAIATWHWLFLINVPAGALAVLLAWRSLPATQTSPRTYDGVAAMLCAGFFAALIFSIAGVAQGDRWELILAEGALAVLCGGLLLRRQSDHPAPMLAADLFRLPVFAFSTATSICAFTTQGLAFVGLPFLFQMAMGRSEVETGFLITPWPAVVAIMAPIAGNLSDRYPAGLLGGVGLLLLSGGMAALALLPSDPDSLRITFWMAVCGAGFGFFQSPNLRAFMSSAPPSRSGGASGIIATARLLGQTIGAASVALCLNVSLQTGPVLALWLGCAFAAIGSITSFLRLLPPRRNNDE